jgi:WD40 repeat protein
VPGGGSIAAAAFAPGGGTLAFAGEWGGPLRLYDLASGAVRSFPTGVRHVVKGIGFAADGRVLAAAGEDGSIRLWDVEPLEETEP